MASRKYSYSLSRARAPGSQVQESSQDLLTTGNPKDDMEREGCGSYLWLFIATCLVVLMATMVAIVVYVECFYKWQFPIRIDCNLDHAGLNYTKCLQRGCKYVVTDGHLPVCFFPEGYGYEQLGDVTEQGDGEFSVRLRRKSTPPLFGGEFNDVFFSVSYETDTGLRLQVAPADVKLERRPLAQRKSTSEKTRKYTVSYSERGETFGVVVTRRDNGKVLFDTRLPGTTLGEQFLQMSTRIASENVFGLGGAGSKTTLKNDLNWRVTSFFTEKAPNDESNNHSGAHPFYMVVEDDGRAHGVFLNTSYPMDVLMQPPIATFRTIGGILDFHLFLGESPEDVIRQFTELIGRPTFPPLWALGPHLALRGNNISPNAALSLVQKLKTRVFQMSAVYLNWGYTGVENAAANSGLSKEMKAVREQLKTTNVRLYLRADPIVLLGDSLRDEDKSFLLTSSNRSQSTVGDIGFIDFTNEKAVEFWKIRCSLLQDNIGFDGLVLELNEPSYPTQVNQTLGRCPDNKWNRPPYTVGKKKNMFDNSICGHAMQDGGTHYSLHNMYGYHHSEATWRNLELVGARKTERQVILSSSTFSGSGQYAGHWFHEPECTWENLKMAVVKTVEFSMLGVPHTGGSCRCTSNLDGVCLAWMHAAAFFPLFINEASVEVEAEVSSLSDTDVNSTTATLLDASSTSHATRHQLIPYFYTLFHEAHTEGVPAIRPLFFEFPKDNKAADVSYQFMWGSSVLVSPRVDKDPEVEAYFPPGLWYNFHNGSIIDASSGQTIILPASESQAHVHIRGGYIVPTYIREQPAVRALSLFVAPDRESKADGALYWDDGITYHENIRDAPHIKGTFAFRTTGKDFEMSMSMEEIKSPDASWVLTIQDVTVYGIRKVSNVTLQSSAGSKHASFTHDPETEVLRISPVNVSSGSYTIKIST